MKVQYEKHPREYTILGLSVVFDELCSQSIKSFLGDAFREIIVVIKNGIYYHFQRVGERDRIARNFLHEIKKGRMTEAFLEREHKKFRCLVFVYQRLIHQKNTTFTKQTLPKFLSLYRQLIYVGYICQDVMNHSDKLSGQKRIFMEHWAQKARRLEETVYKDGEMKFLPRYLNWLVRHELKGMGYTGNDLKYLLFPEVEAYLLQGNALPTVQELCKRCALFFIRHSFPNKLHFCIDREATLHIEKKKLFEQPSDQLAQLKELKGQTAFPGVISGKVRIIRTRQDMRYFHAGEIIVTPMTEPSYLPIMKRAQAFVTNEGGVLCHAAIVAREMKKPCVIGTKIATHVFKDGERVEVDATRGVVRKI